jgi:LysM repeat protein
MSAPHGFLGLGGLRLTPRGRVVVGLLAALLTLPVVTLGASAVASDPGTPTEVRIHAVEPGDTLWAFAATLADAREDVRDVVAQLVELNDLPSAELQVGQVLLLPAE